MCELIPAFGNNTRCYNLTKLFVQKCPLVYPRVLNLITNKNFYDDAAFSHEARVIA